MPDGRPFDRDRIGPDEGLQAAEGDQRLLAIDTRFHEAIDRVEEIVAVELRVETDHRTAQQAGDDFLLPRADAEDFRVRPRNMPERDDGGVRQFIAQHARQQREVVVLDENDRIGALGLAGDGLSVTRIDALIFVPIAFAEVRPHEGHVTERPQAFIGEAVIIAILLLLAQPDAAQHIARICRRHADAIEAIDGLLVGAAAAMGDPGAAAGAHDRLDRRDKAARRRCTAISPALAIMDIRLAVGDDDDVGVRQFLRQHALQHGRRPVDVGAVGRQPGQLEVAQQMPELPGEWREFGRGDRAAAAEPDIVDRAPQRLHPTARQ